MSLVSMCHVMGMYVRDVRAHLIDIPWHFFSPGGDTHTKTRGMDNEDARAQVW